MALQFLFQLDMKKDWVYTEESLRNFMQQIAGIELKIAQMDSGSARRYARFLINGTCQQKDKIDALLETVLQNWALKRLSYVDRAILRLAAYEIVYAEKISAAIAINEAVELAKTFSQVESPSFVNGVLDKINKLGNRE